MHRTYGQKNALLCVGRADEWPQAYPGYLIFVRTPVDQRCVGFGARVHRARLHGTTKRAFDSEGWGFLEQGQTRGDAERAFVCECSHADCNRSEAVRDASIIR